MNNWVIVFKTGYTFEAELVKTTLEDAGIMAIIVNKIDSSYPMNGLAEIHVTREDVLRAIQLIEKKG